MLSLCGKNSEGKTVQNSFDAWRKLQTSPDDSWPEKEMMCSWMTNALSKPVTTADLLRDFAGLKQKKPGLAGFHAYISKTIADFNRLKEQSADVSVYEAKIRFTDNLHQGTRKHVIHLVKDERLKQGEPFLEWLEAVRSRAIDRLHADEGENTEEYATKSEIARLCKTAAVNAVREHKRNNNDNGKDHNPNVSKRAKKKAAREARVAAAAAEKEKKGSFKRDGAKKFEVPKDWKDKMCSHCGMLYHTKENCFHNPENTKAPSTVTKMDPAKLAEVKKTRIAGYETATA
jgi:hypothetical protein